MLAEKLFNLKSFQIQYKAILELSVCKTIPTLKWNHNANDLIEKIDWNNVISIASVLAYSNVNKHLDASLRIAQTILSEDSTNEQQKESAAVVLLSLTNKPAIRLAIDRELIHKDFFDHLPIGLKVDSLKRSFENSILLNDDLVELNTFQKRVYHSNENNNAISLSAPTSAGKSYILCSIIAECLLNNKRRNIVYLVPTRALISQVESDLRDLINKHEIKDVSVSTIPQSDLDENISCLFVFTQERLHWFLAENKNWKLDLLIIDEAHKIEDGARGMLLQQKIEDVLSRNNQTQLLYSSPFTSNPEVLLENLGDNISKEAINTQFVSVNQNLIYVNQVPRDSKKWELNLCLVDESITLGRVELHDRPAGGEMKKLAFIADSISGTNFGNLLYANGAAEAEQVSLLLYDFLPDQDIGSELQALIELVKKTIHNDYYLAKVLSKKIAFHYGNIPLLVREEIERLFKIGEIKHLVCTSTLLEGVNLPAKAVYVRKPTRGRGKPLSSSDFWNLAGRAGRWGKEFSGNIICIEPSGWGIPPSPNKSKQVIKRAVDAVNKDNLLGYIEDEINGKDKIENTDLEFAFGYHYIKYLENSLDTQINYQANLVEAFDQIKKKLSIPDEIITRNPGISPLSQQKLWNYFKDNIHRINEMVPVYPEDSNAFDEYTSLIGRIGKTISKYPHQLNASRAVLLINWMSGKPLKYIIRKSFQSYQERGRMDMTIHKVIRRTMEDIENFARFRFARDSSCYIDILRHFLRVNNNDDLLKEIPQLNLWLEFGVAQKTHLSFLSLGLTRNTTIELTENYVTNTNFSKQQALDWLKAQDLEVMELSNIIKNDIRKALDLAV